MRRARRFVSSTKSDMPLLEGATSARAKGSARLRRAAIRGGAREVNIVSLESFDEMPVLRSTQGHEEFEQAQREGVRFLPRRGPSASWATSVCASVELRARALGV